ncbi:hypothetical protein WAI453_013700 [Rhynchosporium graminicola]
MIEPKDVTSLRVALSSPPLTSNVEAIEKSSVFGILGISAHWIKSVNELGYTVTLVGKDLTKINDILYTPRHDKDLTVSIFIMCTNLIGGAYYYLASDLRSAVLERDSRYRILIGDSERAMACMRIGDGIEANIYMGEPSDCQYTTYTWQKGAYKSTEKIQYQNTIRTETEYVWMNLVRRPHDRPLIRKAYERYRINAVTMVQYDFFIHDDVQTISMSFMLNEDYYGENQSETMIRFFPLN